MVLQQLAPQVRMLMGRAFRSGLVAVVAFSYFPKDGAKGSLIVSTCTIVLHNVQAFASFGIYT
jgi:hypothetical protein